eukprot:evm.model.scf_298.2 EVM.evm.TU.scf_298.2   scf_298:10110-15070(+)
MQVIHAHNSFHLAPEDALLQFFRSPLVQSAAAGLSTGFPEPLEYSHPRLSDLLSEYGVRAFELDVFYDPDGGMFANRAGPKLAGVDGESGEPDLDEPGWKVLHIPDLDFETTCLTFRSCLQEIRDWSTQNPAHLPVFVHIEPMSFDGADFLGESTVGLLNTLLSASSGEPMSLATSLPVDASAFRTLEQEVLDVFNLTHLITPDELRGNESTLAEAVLENNGWPELVALRGRIVLTASEPFLDDLLDLHPNLVGSLMFPTATEDTIDPSHTVFVNVGTLDAALQSPRSSWDGQVDELTSKVRDVTSRGYIVRAFADSATQEPRKNYTYRRDEIVAAGAHLVSTDFPGGKLPQIFPSSYTAQFENGAVAVFNPITASQVCEVIDFVPKGQPTNESGAGGGEEQDAGMRKMGPSGEDGNSGSEEG